MDERTFSTLEYDSLISLLARHVQTPLGARRVSALRPSIDRMEIAGGLDLTSECADFLRTGERFGFSGVEDPEETLSRLHIEDTSLDPHQILGLERLISIGMDLRGQFRDPGQRDRYPGLASLSVKIPDLRKALSDMRGKILPSGEIDDGASPALRLIRREINDARGRLHRTLESILRKQERAVQDDIVTFRNGRFVIPVRTDSRGRVPGVVHGLSSSGQTTFVEPLSVIEQNNDLVRLREQEEIEIARILRSITESLRANLPAIRIIVGSVTEVDFAQAKGRLSLEFHCVRPSLSADHLLRLGEARHILLEHALRGSDRGVVPISLELDHEHRVLIISGPNAGGKTVVLKTVGLISLMCQMGLHVPAREASLPVFRGIFADIGDQQSISANLSTFTAHLRNISEMARRISPPSLVLLDEVGTGTDPDEGSALAVAMVDFFRKTGAMTIATTHYSPVKMWAAHAGGVRNASVEFDEQTLKPTYRLVLGVPGSSAGLLIARRMNMPAEILEQAQSRVDPNQAQATEYLRRLKRVIDEQDALRSALEEERAATARQYEGLSREFEKREASRRAELERAMERIVHDFSAESERLIASIKDRVTAGRLKKSAANLAADLRRSRERMIGGSGFAPAAPSGAAGKRSEKLPAEPAGGREIREGDRVRILSIDREGIVESIQDSACSVLVGALKFRADLHDLQFAGAASPGKSTIQLAAAAAGIDQAFVPEINVIGLTADEAAERVDKFLDEAFLAGAEVIRIIHGHGKGILRKTIAQLLTGHPHVEKFSLAPPEKGGSGVTVAEMAI